jgi:hypothetical protein
MRNKDQIRLLKFVNWLHGQKIQYRLSCEREDAIMVTIRIVGMFIEVEFVDGQPDISYFRGDESVDADFDALMKILTTASK